MVRSGLKLVFMGTPAFSIPVFETLRAAGHDIVHVYTQPPRPAGRGKAVRPSPVQLAAEAAGIPVRCPERIRGNEEELTFFENLDIDAGIVVAYGLILPKRMLKAPHLGCLNIHASLLPRWRGASPIQSAILAGDDKSGVSIMQMDEGLDTGDVLAEATVNLAQDETALTLHDRLSIMGAELLIETLQSPFSPVPQAENGVTYAERLSRETGRLDWSTSATHLDCQIRGLTPWPGAFTTLDKTVLKIGAARIVSLPAPAPPGICLNDALTIACKDHALQILKLQRPGKSMMTADEFLRGTQVTKGTRLGT